VIVVLHQVGNFSAKMVSSALFYTNTHAHCNYSPWVDILYWKGFI